MKIDFQESLNALPQPLTLERWTEMTHSEADNKAVADFPARRCRRQEAAACHHVASLLRRQAAEQR